MSVQWLCKDCPAYIEARTFDEDSDEWHSFARMREALIWALLVTGFPPKSEWAITEDNWEAVFVRLNKLERAAGAYRATSSEDIRFTPEEIESMIGLRVNAGNKTEREFMKWITDRLDEYAQATLRGYRRSKEVHDEQV